MPTCSSSRRPTSRRRRRYAAVSDRFSSAITSRRVMLPWARVHSSRVWSSSRCPPAARMSRSVIFSRPPRISAVCTTLDSRAKSIGRRDWGESSTWGSSPGERTFCTFSSSRRTALVSSMSRSGRCSSPRSKSTWSQVRFTSSLPCTPICQLIHRAMPAAELSSF